MKEGKIAIEKLCWNKYKEIHSNKIVYLQNIYDIFNKLSKLLSDFESKYKSLEIEQLILPIENNKINETMKLINKSIISYIDINRVMIKNILNTFKDIHDLLKNENKIYDKVLLTSMQYEEEKQKMIKSKNLFYEKMGIIEDSIKSTILKNKSKDNKSTIKIDKKAMSDAIDEFIIYRISVGETNVRRVNFNKSQNTLLKLYQKVILEKEAELYQKINMNFYNVQKMENETTSMMIEKIKDKKKVNKKEYNNEIISLFSSKDKEDREIELKNYNIKHKPYPTNNNGTTNDINEANKISEEIIRTMRNYLDENFPDCHLQIQEAEIELPEIINKYLEIEIELTDQEKNDILKLIKEDMTIYPQLLTKLSRVRSTSKLYNSKTHIEFLGYILKEILLISEKKQDYRAAKNCILLSQTYYVKDDDNTNQKIFLFESIKNNKWINTGNFWRIFINEQIKFEFNKFESLYPDLNFNLEKQLNIPKNLESKIKDVYFGILLPSLSNMKEINIDKRIIIKIIDEFLDKYKYLDQATINDLFALLSTNPEEIVKLRNEYKENPNLENELMNNLEKNE